MASVGLSIRGSTGVGVLVGIGVIKPNGSSPKLINPIPPQFYLGNNAPVVANPIGLVIYTPST